MLVYKFWEQQYQRNKRIYWVILFNNKVIGFTTLHLLGNWYIEYALKQEYWNRKIISGLLKEVLLFCKSNGL